MANLILDKYELVRELKAPGVSKSWLARSHGAEGPVFVVITGFPPSLTEHDGFRAELENDASVTTHLRDGVFARILDYGTDRDRLWIVREVVCGEPLEGVLRAAQRAGYPSLPVPLATGWIAEAARVVERAHAQRDDAGWSLNIVHGGLSPHNVYLHHSHQIRVGEFTTGRVRHKANFLTKGRAFAEILPFRAPEQVRKEDPTTATDVYLLGLIFWEMLVGRSPFDADDVDLQIVNSPPEMPSRFNPAISEDLDAVIARSLAASPGDRYDSAEELAKAIDAAAASFKPAFGAVPDVDRLLPDRMSAWRSLESAISAEDSEKVIAWAGRTLLEEPQAGGGSDDRGRSAQEDATTQRVAQEEVAGAAKSMMDADDDGQEQDSTRPVSMDDVERAAKLAREANVDEEARREMAKTLIRGSGAAEEETQPQVSSPDPEQSAESEGSAGGYHDEMAETLPTDTRAPDADVDEMAEHDETTSVKRIDEDAFRQARQDAADSEMPEAREEMTPDPLESETPFSSEMGPGISGESDVIDHSGGSPDPVEHAADRGRGSIEISLDAEPPSGVADREHVPELGAFSSWGEDDEEDEGPWVEPFDVDVLVGAPERELSAAESGTKPAAEVIRIVDGRVLDAKVLKGLSRLYREKGQNVSVRLGLGKAAIRFDPQFVSGWVQRAQGDRVKVGDTGKLQLQPGDKAELDDQGVVHRIRVFYPPTPPKRKKAFISQLGVRMAAITLLGSAVLHVLGLLSVMLTSELGVDLTVQKAERPAEIFAEGKLKKPEKKKEKPKPPKKKPPKPKPKKKIAKKKPADPTEQAAIIPKSVRKKLDKRMRSKKTSEDKAENLLAALKSPVQGEGETIDDVVTNIDAANKGSASAVNKVAGTLGTIADSDQPNIATGGGGKLGDIGGKVAKDAGKLKKRKKSGKVRGKVSSIKALAKVQGQLSRSDVYSTINKHIGRIQACYENQLLKNPSLAGKITFEWTVKTSGKVKGAREISSTVGSPKVSKCVQKIIRRMKFPKPKGGEVTIRYPFIFRSSQ